MRKKHLHSPGDRVGRLTLIGRCTNKIGGAWQIFWMCRCDCGTKKTVRQSNLKSTKSCGCWRDDIRRKNRIYHPGQKVGRWTLLSRFTKKTHGQWLAFWKCKCECGTNRVVQQNNLGNGSRSCGCLHKEMVGAAQKVHGESDKTTEWNTWMNMIQRCENENNPQFKDYGGRGIRVCTKWRKSYVAFLKDVGRRPSRRHTLNRKDNDKGYFPNNVNWETHSEQNSNKRSNVIIKVGGEKKTVTQWARSLGMVPQTVFSRLRRGWTPGDAVKTPVAVTDAGIPGAGCHDPAAGRVHEGE